MELDFFRVTRVYSRDQASYFEDLPPFQGHLRDQDYLTDRMAAKAYRIHQYAQGHYEDWHTPFIASCAIIFLCGRQQIEISSGEKRIFSLGDLLYLEDTQGQGHRTYGLEAGTSLILELDSNMLTK